MRYNTRLYRANEAMRLSREAAARGDYPSAKKLYRAGTLKLQALLQDDEAERLLREEGIEVVSSRRLSPCQRLELTRMLDEYRRQFRLYGNRSRSGRRTGQRSDRKRA